MTAKEVKEKKKVFWEHMFRSFLTVVVAVFGFGAQQIYMTVQDSNDRIREMSESQARTEERVVSLSNRLSKNEQDVNQIRQDIKQILFNHE